MLSVATVVRNEAKRLDGFQREIERLADAGQINEVIVLDQASTDGTGDLIAAWTGWILVRDMNRENVRVVGLFEPREHGYCELHRQRTIDATDAANPWVLILDVDERIDPECDLLRLTAEADADGKGAVMLRRVNVTVDLPGKPIQTYFGDDGQIRLIRKDRCSWPTDPHARPHVRGTGIMAASGPHDQIIHAWTFTDQEAKRDRVVEAVRRHHGDEAANRMRAFHDSAIAGFKENLGVR